MRILGIDVGTTSIKAVELESAFGRYDIREYYEHPLELGINPVLAITRLIQALPRKPDRVVLALKAGQVTFRNLQLPTRDRKAIQAGVNFELEDDLPFSMENAAFDFSILNQNKQGTYLHVTATLKKYLVASLSQWLEAEVDPDLITTEGWAYRTLFNRILSPPEQEEPVLLAHLGGERSILHVHWKGAPILTREISWGGKDLTQTIAAKYGIPFDQAEHAKLDHGFVVPEGQRDQVTQEQIEFSDILMQPVLTLLSEIRQAELTSKSITRRNLKKVVVAGGTSLLPGLSKVIEENLRVPVSPLLSLSSIATSGVTYTEHTDAVFVSAVSLALCLVGSERSSVINFRKRDFSKKGQASQLSLANLRRPLMGLAAVIVCFIISLVVQSLSYKDRIKRVDDDLTRSLKRFFGAGLGASATRTYLSDTAALKTAINKELGKQRELALLLGPNPHSPLDFVKDLSSSVPKEIVVDMTKIQVGASPSTPYSSSAEQSTNLTFVVSNSGAADRLAKILEGKVKGLKKGSLEETPFGDGKKFKVTFTGNPTEAAYGR